MSCKLQHCLSQVSHQPIADRDCNSAANWAFDSSLCAIRYNGIHPVAAKVPQLQPFCSATWPKKKKWNLLPAVQKIDYFKLFCTF